MSKRGRGGSSGAKFRISLGLPVGAVINCADNTGMRSARIWASYPSWLADLNNKSHCFWVRWQSPCAVKSQSVMEHFSSRLEICHFNLMFWILLRCSAELFLFSFIGSAITGPVAKECADLWPRIASNAGSIA
ncbi:60S ribosomal protein L23-like [Sinocyclocheilus rhinocerous]|uniref:60S ribosomal protein L23-like n=1 Tax=Sinocyclocheilus rhinocerous TaxID=307959 RepID=UPI0007BA728E|nr:PREDICTED: 60S ribosomal protein L23-like [Sinocyclocheilus rhinocerous]